MSTSYFDVRGMTCQRCVAKIQVRYLYKLFSCDVYLSLNFKNTTEEGKNIILFNEMCSKKLLKRYFRFLTRKSVYFIVYF